MKYAVLWFISTCMTVAFIEVAFLRHSPEQALMLGVIIGATSIAVYFRGLRRLERYLGLRS
jgi:Flp pilus assembly protein TadB